MGVGLSCLFAASCCSPNMFGLFCVLYVLGFTINQASSYMVVIHHMWLWFPDIPCLVTGICICGYGAGAIILNPISNKLVNPDGLSPDLETMYFPTSVNNNFVSMLRTLVILWTVLAILSICLFFGGPTPDE